MKGSDFVAVKRLSTLKNETLAAPGESCDKVASSSLPWLLEAGDIVPKPEQPQTASEEREETIELDETGFVGEE